MQLRMNSTIYLLATWRLRGALCPTRSDLKTKIPLWIVKEKLGMAGGSLVVFILSNILNCYKAIEWRLISCESFSKSHNRMNATLAENQL